MRILLLAAAAVGLVACDGRLEEGRVDAQFQPAECPPGESQDKLREYGFNPNRLQTQRYQKVLILQVLQHRAVQEETDNLSVRLDLTSLIDDGSLVPTGAHYELANTPLTISLSSTIADVALNLYESCPDRPNALGVSGDLVLQRLRVAIDDVDTGQDERITASVNADLEIRAQTVVRASLQATFDYEPPRSSLITFE